MLFVMLQETGAMTHQHVESVRYCSYYFKFYSFMAQQKCQSKLESLEFSRACSQIGKHCKIVFEI